MSTIVASYATVEDVYTEAPMINSVSEISSANVFAAIALTEGYVNGVVGKAWALPFTEDIPLLTKLVVDGSTYRLLRKHFTQEAPNENAWVDSYKDDFNQLLEEIMEGKVELLGTGGNLIARGANQEAWSNTKDRRPTFDPGLDISESFVDPDRTEDARAERGF